MRTRFLALALLLGLLAMPALPAGPAGFDVTVQAAAAQQPDAPSPPARVEVDIDSDGNWYANPVWLALGAIALIVLVLLIVSASRTGGTTIVKD
jgi:hypothetical protein